MVVKLGLPGEAFPFGKRLCDVCRAKPFVRSCEICPKQLCVHCSRKHNHLMRFKK